MGRLLNLAAHLFFALKRQHRDIIFLGGFADMGKKVGCNLLRESQGAIHRLEQ
jgi:hypothetical protein